MAIMALDHVRDFLHQQVTPDGHDFQDPTNMSTTYPLLFFTRFITHYCAPTFVLLTGLSAYLVGQRKSRKELSAFLIKRGLWLVLVEVLIMSLAFTFDPLYHVVILQVIWVIGWSMVILGLLVWLPYWSIVGLGLLIFFGHNLLDIVPVPDGVKTSPLGMMLYYSYTVVISLSPDRFILVLYALLPWLGVMLLGYGLGRWFEPAVEAARRRKSLLMAGGGLLLFFFIFRYYNIYGDQMPWQVQPRGAMFSVLSFFNVTKYPASLLYYAVTLGCALIALALLEGVDTRFTRIMNVFGRVPFFYYIIHFYILHIVTVIVFFLQGFGVKDIVPPGLPLLFRPPSLGFPLWGVYVAWFLLLVLLYPLCKRYDGYKSTHSQWWLSYL